MDNQNCLRRTFLLFGRLASNGIRMEMGSFGITFNVNNLPIGFFDGLFLASLLGIETTFDPAILTRRLLCF